MPLNYQLSWGVTSGDVTGSLVGAEAGEPTSSLSVPLEPSQRGTLSPARERAPEPQASEEGSRSLHNDVGKPGAGPPGAFQLF